MKPKESAAFIKSLFDRGYVEDGDTLYPPEQAAALGILTKAKKKREKPGIRTGWTDDTRNIRNKEKYRDEFIMLMNITFPDLEVWPEFYCSTERQWQIDYFFPQILLAIEQEGGVWTGGRHTRGKGFIADMDKYNFISSKGWTLIRRTPDQMKTQETIELIKTVQKKFVQT